MFPRRPLLGLIAALAALASVQVAAVDEPAAVRPYHRVPDRAQLTSEQKKAETFVAKLFGRAQAATQQNDYQSALTAYEDALDALEEAYGPDDPRLAEALHGIVTTRVGWDNYSAQYGFGMRAGLNAAVQAQERIVEIYEASANMDPASRVAALVDLGDCYLYTNDKRATDTYRRAWQLQAQLESREAADDMFNAIGIVRLVLPENPLGHTEWKVTVTYDVDAQGHVSVTDVSGNAPQPIIAAMREDYARARFRPRFVGGEPVDTRGVVYTHKYAASTLPSRRNFGA